MLKRDPSTTLKALAICLVHCLILFPADCAHQIFIAKEKGQVIKSIGDGTCRFSPFSTFKVPLALMGFDNGILKTPDEPLIEFTTEIQKSMQP